MSKQLAVLWVPIQVLILFLVLQVKRQPLLCIALFLLESKPTSEGVFEDLA